MSDISIYFNTITLQMKVEETSVGNQYLNLVKKMYAKSFPIYRDRIKYTTSYLLELANETKLAFGWEWTADDYNLSVTALLHKDIEILLGKTGFKNVPAKYDNLLHELHYCLHLVQHNEAELAKVHRGNIQIEWYNDCGFKLDPAFEFQTTINFGDCILQNPYVGHGPLQIFQEHDWTNLTQTCKFHNFVKPGIVIYTGPSLTINIYDILNEFIQNDADFVLQCTEEKILHYTGFPIIGKIINLNKLDELVNDKNTVELIKIEFDND